MKQQSERKITSSINKPASTSIPSKSNTKNVDATNKSFWSKFRFKDISIVKLVYIGFGILALMLVIASVSTFMALSKIDDSFKNITQKSTPLVITAKSLDKSLTETHKDLVEILNSKNSDRILQLTNTYKEEKGKLEEIVAKINELKVDNSELKARISEFNNIFQKYEQYTSNIPAEYYEWFSKKIISDKNISSYRALVNLYTEEYNALKYHTTEVDIYVHQLMLAPEMLKGSIVTTTDQALSSEDSVKIGKALESNQKQIKQYNAMIDDIKKNYPEFDNSLGKYYSDFVRDTAGDKGVLAVHFDLAKRQDTLQKETTDATNELKKLSTIIDDITTICENEMKSSVTSSNKIMDFSYLEVSVLLAIGIFVAVLVAFVIGRVIRVPLTRIVNVIHAMSNGDMTGKVNYKSKSEFGYLAQNMNNLIDTLRSTLSDLSDSATTLQQNAHSNSESMSITVEKIKAQQEETKNIVSFMELVESAASDVAKSTDISLNTILDVNVAAENGRKIMSDNITTNHALADQLDRTSVAISEVDKTSNDIGQIVEVIKSIAEQTNLLALNAAIESARAGEHGRGFAVVADEVRSLAQKTSEATNQVNQLIESLQSVVIKAVASIKDCKVEMEHSVLQTSEVNSSIEEIKASLTTISDMAHQIAQSAEQQRSTATEVGSNIDRISEISNDNVEEIHKANASCLALDDLATNQKNLVSQFKF